MGCKTLIGVAEYLHTSFEAADRDYLDGETEERHLGERGHSLVQFRLLQRLAQQEGAQACEILPEIRVQMSEQRFRVADLAVWPQRLKGSGVPTTVPSLVIEILSPEDRMVRMLPRLADCLRAGVKTIWVVDPDERLAMIFTADQPGCVVADVLRAAEPVLEVSLRDVLPSPEDLG